MLSVIINSLQITFYLLFFLVPLVLWPKTSEVFEFNKIVLTYDFTAIIASLWIIRMILEKRIIFQRTLLDVPLLIFLGSQILSTFFSIDPRTSLYGFYSRFNGGLLSVIAYSLLYWAFVSNMDRKKSLCSIYALLTSACLVSIYGILEHFGIDKNIWVQDVQNRVFSTLGQPNWLAAWVVALSPLTWALSITDNSFLLNTTIPKKYIWMFLDKIFFLTLIFTKSKSGFVGYLIASLIFGLMNIVKNIINKSKTEKRVGIKTLFIEFYLPLFILIFSFGTPWTKSVPQYLKKTEASVSNTQKITGPALEAGGTDSGKIRKIVWKGAFDIFKAYPIFGSGVETFGLSFYFHRPVEHNLVSEWDFLYNKAHNEYLNYAATTGIVGIISYIILIVGIITQILNFNTSISLSINPELVEWIKFSILNQFSNLKKGKTEKAPETGKYPPLEASVKRGLLEIINFGIFAGFTSILITNFFGFSVVCIAILFFLFPALAISLNIPDKNEVKVEKNTQLDTAQKYLIGSVFLGLIVVIVLITRYWMADVTYAKGKNLNDSGSFIKGREYLTKAVKIMPKEALYWSELSKSTTQITLNLIESKDQNMSQEYAKKAENEILKAVDLSPKYVNYKRDLASVYIKLSFVDPKYMQKANKTLEDAVKMSPTEAKLMYNWGLTFIRLGNLEKAREIMENTIQLKPNYRNARLGLGLVLIDLGDKKRAKEQFQYILEKIAPDDSEAKRQLAELGI